MLTNIIYQRIKEINEMFRVHKVFFSHFILIKNKMELVFEV